MKRSLITGAAVLALGLLAGCSAANQKDVTGIPGTQPDSIVVYTNVDQHPNFAKVCAQGIAFLTTSRDYPSIERLPEWDWTCPKPTGFQQYQGPPTTLPPTVPAPRKSSG